MNNLTKLILIVTLTTPTIHFPVEPQRWTPVSPEDAEENYLNLKISAICEQFTAMGSGSSAGCQAYIFQFLKSVGTPTSLKIAKQLIANGRLPKHYLNMI